MDRADFRLKFFVGDAVIGPGKVRLLEAIDEHGSLSAAARQLGIGYRRAHFLIETLQQGCGQLLLETVAGGSGGGGSQLTDYAKQLIARYRQSEASCRSQLQPTLDWLDQHRS